MLERHYGTSITTAGIAISAGTIAATIAISLIPGVRRPRPRAGKHWLPRRPARKPAKLAVKRASKVCREERRTWRCQGWCQPARSRCSPPVMNNFSSSSPLFSRLAIADIHGMELDQDQAQALVYGLSNERVSQQQIATMAADLSRASSGGVVGVGNRIAAGRTDWSHWADTLADTLPGGAAQSLVRTMQTGQLDTVRENLSGKQQATIEYGVGALAGGVTRFVFGRDVIARSSGWPSLMPQTEFPAHLAVDTEADPDGDDGES